MSQTALESDRLAQFRLDMAEMKVKTGAAGGEQRLLVLGIALMVVGILVSVLSYFAATEQTNALDQNELVLVGFTGVSLTIAGSAFFLRYSLARFLRFWLLRQAYENQSHIDRVVDQLRGAP